MASGTLEIFNDSSLSIHWSDHPIVYEVVSSIFKDFKRSFGWINVIFLDTKSHTDLNVKHLSHDYATDVLTFDFSDREMINGEIYINVDVAQENATYYAEPAERELKRLIVHGVLHVVGVNDKTEEEQKTMTGFEEKYLKRFM